MENCNAAVLDKRSSMHPFAAINVLTTLFRLIAHAFDWASNTVDKVSDLMQLGFERIFTKLLVVVENSTSA